MSELTFVTLAKDRALRIPPHFDLFPKEGKSVDLTNTYWKRALKDGDIVIPKAPENESPAPKHSNKGEK